MKKKTEGRAVKVISFLSQTWRPKGEEFKQPYLLSSTYLYSAFILLHERNKIRNYFTQRKTTTVKNRNMLDEKLSHKVPLVRKSAFFFKFLVQSKNSRNGGTGQRRLAEK